MKIYRLREVKTNQLKKLLKNGNITEEQFNIADDFFKRHNAFEREIDWNRGLNITWDELSSVIYKERNSKSQIRKKIRKGLEGFEEGNDYLILAEGIFNDEPWTAYKPLNWEVSRAIASHYVEPHRGDDSYMDSIIDMETEVLDAQWCTAYQGDSDDWDYHTENESFIYLCGESIPSKKVAISISEEEEDASGFPFLYECSNDDTFPSLHYNIWDFYDHYDTVMPEELPEEVVSLIPLAYFNNPFLIR